MRKGEIWLVDIPSSKGHEQFGPRPVIITSNPEVNVIAIIPLTTNLDYSRFKHTLTINSSSNNGLNKKSLALIFQVRAIDKNKLIKNIGIIENLTLEAINKKLKDFLIL
jgi:mRNA interferase MazF|tara:strand:+ start:120 stop:446 length:327 start_codon:yes stop_codon:yes gene_type:complete